MLTSHCLQSVQKSQIQHFCQTPERGMFCTEKGSFHIQVGSPLPAPVPVAAPAPDSEAVIARVLNESLAPAHAPVALPSPRTVEGTPHRPKGAAAHTAQVPAAAAQLPAPASGLVPNSPSPSQGLAQTPFPNRTVASYSARDAMSYISGRR